MPEELTKEFIQAERFINPYNFVEVQQDTCDRADYTDEQERRSGAITCELITKTPLIIPDTDAKVPQGNEHYYYPFMKINDEYTIPGSSIRGPVRSVYETLTNSCFSTMRKDSYITQRSQNAMKPGLLILDENGDWSLYQAERCLIPMKYDPMIKARANGTVSGSLLTCKLFTPEELSKYSFGCEIAFKYELIGKKQNKKKLVTAIWPSDEKPASTKRGYLKFGEPFSEKKFESIFLKKDRKEQLSSDQIKEKYSLLANTLKAYRDDAINKNLNPDEGEPAHSGYAGYPLELDHLSEGTVIPIWYNTKNGKFRQSPGSIGRFTYEKTEKTLVNNLAPCTERESLCKACALFGMTSQENKGNYASKVRFGDAHLTEEFKSINPETCELKELASPHISYLPFYANHHEDQLFDYDDQNAGIRGRKFYWHHQPQSGYYENTGEKNKRNAKMDLMGGFEEKEVRFQFTVWFDSITSAQLEDLVWVLTLGENSKEGKHCIKIGHGKPFGFGSCKIIITELKERFFDGTVYKEEPLEVSEILALWEESHTETKSTKTFKQMMNILSFDAISGKVEYPSVLYDPNVDYEKNEVAPHQWFSENYKFGSKSARYNLPDISEDAGAEQKVSLPKLWIGDNAPQSNQGNHEEVVQTAVSPENASRAIKAVLVSKDPISESSLNRFQKYSIDVKKEYFNKTDIKELSKSYRVLLINNTRTDNKTLGKIIDAKKIFDEVWIYNKGAKSWGKQ